MLKHEGLHPPWLSCSPIYYSQFTKPSRNQRASRRNSFCRQWLPTLPNAAITFVQEQRQLERSSTRSRPDVGDVLSFCSGQVGFRARRHLYEICIVASQACGLNPLVLSHLSMWLCFSGVPVDDACDPWVFSKV